MHFFVFYLAKSISLPSACEHQITDEHCFGSVSLREPSIPSSPSPAFAPLAQQRCPPTQGPRDVSLFPLISGSDFKRNASSSIIKPTHNKLQQQAAPCELHFHFILHITQNVTDLRRRSFAVVRRKTIFIISVR